MPSTLDNSTLPDIDGVDTVAGLSRMNNNLNSYIKLLKYFQRDYESMIDDIQQLLDKQAYSELRQLVHTIKGESANLSMTEISSLAATIEQACIKQTIDKIPSLISALEVALSKVIFGISDLETQQRTKTCDTLVSKPVVNTKELDHEQVKQLLQQMLDNMDKNLNKVDEAMDEIKILYQSMELPENLQKLEQFVFNFDKDQAKVLIDKLLYSN